MKVVDPGHVFELDTLDGRKPYGGPMLLWFLKRVGEKFPGNGGQCT